MIVGVPKEIKSHEYRVALLPVGAEELRRTGNQVLVEHGAGLGSGIRDEDYERAGATIIADRAEIWGRADMIIKVKEPQPEEFPLIRENQILFTYFHFAADERLTLRILESGASAVAYETLQDRQGRLPLLTPMSEVAGRMSIQEGAKYLERPEEGRGILLGGVPGVEPAQVVILGGGIVGTNAAKVAAGFGANVTILDNNVDRLRYLDDILPNVTTLFSDRHNIRDQLVQADLVIGAVLVRGARAPRLVERADLKTMKSGAVIVDVAVDQGGCFETTRPTTHEAPTFIVDEVVHYCVANMPGAVGRTSTYALCNVTGPYAVRIASLGLSQAVHEDPCLPSAINIHQRTVTDQAVARTFGLDFHPYIP